MAPYITPEAKEAALEALDAMRGDRESEDVADAEVRKALGELANKTLSWVAARRRLMRARMLKGSDLKPTIALAELLLKGWGVADIVTDVAPSSVPPPPSGDPQLEVNCPSTHSDHRLVIVGQLPRAQLFAAVFVSPQHDPETWYPQSDPDPIRAGVAFACHASLGHPHGIGHTTDPPLPVRCELRIYALERRWAHGRNAVKTSDLEAMIGQLGVVAMRGQSVTRSAAEIENAVIADSTGTISFGIRGVVRCSSPVTLTWKGGGGRAQVFRLGRPDQLVFQDVVANRLVLDLEHPGPGVGGSARDVIGLPAPGLYHVKLYSLRRSFLDPHHELWLDVGARS
jgi:hypothetical protein